MSQAKYFRDELNYLRQQGQVFSEAHPQLARYLQNKNSDPDVERLLEGFAFLTGKLREKVDDEFPELTHSLISLLWPNYLRPIPSMCIMQFAMNAASCEGQQKIASGTELDSQPVLGTRCRFTSCRDVDLYPIEISNILIDQPALRNRLQVKLQVINDASLNDVAPKKLRLYLSADSYSAQTLYLWLDQYLKSIKLCLAGRAISVAADKLTPVGFEQRDSLLPGYENTFDGYRILQEYLAFPEAFLFFDLQLPAAEFKKLDQPISECELMFFFDRSLPDDVRINHQSLQLFCTPAVNLFEHDADPINLSGKQTEYKLQPSSRSPAHYEVFSVIQAQGWVGGGQGRQRGKHRMYHAFESFHHEIDRSQQQTSLYYRMRVRQSNQNTGFDHSVAFVREDEISQISHNETVSLQLLCSNRQLPLELAEGQINQPTDQSPNFASFRNISKPTAPIRPALEGGLLWQLISNFSLNYLSLLSKEALTSLLKIYDFKALSDRQSERIASKRLQGIAAINSKSTDLLMSGLPVRGLHSTIQLSQSHFASEGDLYCFASILRHFFSLYASINSFHQLEVINLDNQESYQWLPKTGVQPLI
ncbi:type VI secretion system baseplate subunit TssF [Pelagibaculum spongiae]|uniref:Type VI secretion system baseplate subunit TssF n=1 Tax=Pelagibaculum spongiae TaxID=2080658 RepID=A0A2V1GSU4_9GAMM|nr:type VI secretion system baseplate subunit TssF [Pelagibaculum spongiae]PVZ68775.1 type VI secretion system baseplate subunit TssF [Pelagibaculum spongiae]